MLYLIFNYKSFFNWLYGQIILIKIPISFCDPINVVWHNLIIYIHFHNFPVKNHIISIFMTKYLKFLLRVYMLCLSIITM